MRNRRPVDVVAVVLVILFIAAPSAHALTLEEIFESVLNLAITVPLPSAICPLVIAAKFADTDKVAALELTASEREHRILEEYITAERDRQAELERQMKACAQIKSELIRIKNRRAAKIQKAREAKEGGRWFSFQGRFEVSPIPCEYYSGTYETGLLNDGFGDIPGDDPPGPISAVITPTFVMCDGDSVPVLSSSLTVWGSEDDYWNNWPIFRLYFGEFGYEMASFNIAPGVPTGINRATLVGSPPGGEYNYDTHKFEMRFEGMLTNDLYNRSAPILFFASIFGGVGEEYYGDDWPYSSKAPVAADVPMIVPLTGDRAVHGLPKVMGAHILEWDADTKRLRLLENTTLAPDADIAMVRYNDGSYSICPAVDESLGAHVAVDPLIYIDESPAGVFNFSDAAIRIEKCRATLLTGFLRKPVLNGNTGGFFADLEITEVSGRSPVLAQIHRSSGKKMMQIAVGAAAYDLVKLMELVRGTTGVVAGRMQWPEIFHIGVVRDCDLSLTIADLNDDGIVNIQDFAELTQYWLQTESLADIAPFPDGDHIVDTEDLSAFIRGWLGRCE